MSKLRLPASRGIIVGLAAAAVGFRLARSFLFADEFRVTSIQVITNSVQIVWSAPGGSNYVVQSVAQSPGAGFDTNFVDLSPVIFVPNLGLQSTSYIHAGGMLNSTSRFYRVRSFPAPPVLQIQPTNVIIGLGMTNRYKVLAIYPDNTTQDVTGAATFTSLSNSIAQAAGIANGFALVRGTSAGKGVLRAVYQGTTNTVILTVSQLTGMYTVPPLSQISDYVEGNSTSVKVMGIFANGQTNNITPASHLEGAVEGGGAGSATRVDYNVRADVANSFALITGQSAADGQTVQFEAGGVFTDPITVHWCNYVSVTLLPHTAQISLGATQEFLVIGNRADGTPINVASFEVNGFTSSDNSSAQADPNTLRVVGLAPGTATITVNVINLVNCGALSDSAILTVISPPVIANQPADQTVVIGSDAIFNITASGASPLAYQWQINGANIVGATTNSLTISNANYTAQGDYHVIVTNTYGSVTSLVATLTVAQAGVPLWTNRYNGPGNGSDYAQAIAVDSGGNVFVTGAATVSGGTYDYATIKYSGAGAPLWTNRYNGPGNGSDYAQAIGVDSDGNVFVTGYATVSGGTYDYATIKYSGAGVPLWTNRYNGPGNGSDYARAIAVDSSNNVFVTGYSTGSGSGYDYATIKYSSGGVPLWTNRYNSPGNSADYAEAVAVDGSGNVFVTGYSTIGSGSGYDYATIKYSSAGVPLWTNRYNGPGNSDDYAQAIAVDSSGNVFVTGSSIGTGGYDDYATIKYSGAGVPLWTNRYNGPGNSVDAAQAIAVDGNGNVFVTGNSISSGGYYDYATIKYSGAGAPLWTNRYNGPGNEYDSTAAIAVDESGNVFVTGFATVRGFTFDYATIKYSGAGAILWISRYNGPGNSSDSARAIAVDSSGNVFVTGSSDSTSDYATIKYCSGTSPPNDNFSGRIVLGGSGVTTNANNACASKELGEPNHAANNIGGLSLWWSWTAPANGPVTISTCGSDFDTLLGVYTGGAFPLTLVTNNDDSCLFQSSVQFNAGQGNVYQIAVDGYRYPLELVARSGNLTLTIQQ